VRAPDRLFGGYVFDLDGTVYLGEQLLPGAKATLDELKARSNVVYLTNKPLEVPADYAAKLTRLGVATRPEEVISSTDALLLYLGRRAPGAGVTSALVLTGAVGLEEALGSPDRPDYVIEHLGDLLPRENTDRAAAWTRDERNL
jgi:ribonucleotide monophosphatase NagD (HAD superfamily)